MEHFTPVASLTGGALIGLSAAVLWVADGRIAGISGIVGGLRLDAGADWRIAFLIGLIAAPLAYAWVMRVPDLTITAGPAMLLAAGLLVGIGTRLGGGCTSGHGVCGIARLSKRSIVATATFMVVAAATVYVARHVVGQ